MKKIRVESCTEKGEAEYKCSMCSDTYIEEIAAKGHTWKEATCTAPKTCNECKLTKGDELGHNYVNRTCSRCGEKQLLSVSELNDEIIKQPIYVSSTKYVVQSDKYKSLYPDMLSATIYNNSSEKIKNAVIAFVAWDVNGLPVKIRGEYDFGGGNYVKQGNANNINLVPNSYWGSNSGLSLDDNQDISTFKAIVVSYERFDGTEWENPLFDNWCKLFEDKPLY